MDFRDELLKMMDEDESDEDSEEPENWDAEDSLDEAN